VIVVSDSSPLITLASVGELELLRNLFDEVLIPGRVWDEVVQADRAGAEAVLDADWIRVIAAPDNSFLFALQTELDAGEAEAISLAFDVEAEVLLLDERSARNLAISIGFKVIGVLGVLQQAKRRGFLPHLRPVLDRMRTWADFRISDRLYEATLRDAGEA
jgi:uncharacterized protein